MDDKKIQELQREIDELRVIVVTRGEIIENLIQTVNNLSSTVGSLQDQLIKFKI